MEDKGSGKDVVTVWKLDDVDTLRKEKSIKEQQKADKLAQKAEIAKKQAAKEEQSRIPPELLFRDKTDQYSLFDTSGLPTHDALGEPLTKNASKALQKEMKKQRELHDKYLESGGKV